MTVNTMIKLVGKRGMFVPFSSEANMACFAANYAKSKSLDVDTLRFYRLDDMSRIEEAQNCETDALAPLFASEGKALVSNTVVGEGWWLLAAGSPLAPSLATGKRSHSYRQS
jgi:hypothetical protein